MNMMALIGALPGAAAQGLIWGILAIAVPCFQFVAGLLPLLFPNIVIKAVGILGKKQAV